MTTLAAQPEIRLPVGKLSAGLGGAVVAGCILATLVLLFFDSASLMAAPLAALAVFGGVAPGLGLLGRMPARSAVNWAFVILSISTLRMFVSILIGMGFYMKFELEVAAFWGTFMGISFGVLFMEVRVLTPSLRGQLSIPTNETAPEASQE